MHTEIELFLSEKIERLEADLRYWRRVAKARPTPAVYAAYDSTSHGLMTSAPTAGSVVTWRHAEFCRPGLHYVFFDNDPLDAWRTSAEEFHAVVDDFGTLVKVN